MRTTPFGQVVAFALAHRGLVRETDLLIMPGHVPLDGWVADQFPPCPQHPLALVVHVMSLAELTMKPCKWDTAFIHGDAMLLLPGTT